MKVVGFSGYYIDERTYIMCEKNEILMIDAVRNHDLYCFLEKLHPARISIILTHEHIDHIYGIHYYRERYHSEVLCSRICGERIKDSRTNLARYQEVILGDIENDTGEKSIDFDYSCKEDMSFKNQLEWNWNGHKLFLFETPGHSPGSICIVMDNNILFTGDTLLKKDKIITRLPGGSKKEYLEKTLPFLQSISKDVLVYPGHGESGIMREFDF